jgi:hypothetical protein
MVSAAVGVAVAQRQTRAMAQADLGNLVQQIHQAMWRPAYPKIELVRATSSSSWACKGR